MMPLDPLVTVIGVGNMGGAMAANLLARGYPVGALYREMSNDHFNSHYVSAISAIGTPLFPRGRAGLAGMVRFLRGGGTLRQRDRGQSSSPGNR